jgi:hypothetical protein
MPWRKLRREKEKEIKVNRQRKGVEENSEKSF